MHLRKKMPGLWVVAMCLFVISWVPLQGGTPLYSGASDVYICNFLNVGVGNAYADSDNDAHDYGTVAANTTESANITWNSVASITVDLYLPTIPRGQGYIRFYNGSNGQLIHSIALSQTQHYYTYAVSNPPASVYVYIEHS